MTTPTIDTQALREKAANARRVRAVGWPFGRPLHVQLGRVTIDPDEAEAIAVALEARAPGDDSLTLTATLALGRALEALSGALKIASEATAADALDHIADYLNGCDALEESDPVNYERWRERGRP